MDVAILTDLLKETEEHHVKGSLAGQKANG